MDLVYKGYLIDLDGTMYRGNEPIPGAKEFIDDLYQAQLPYLFVTNNSSSTQSEIAHKLVKMGIKATPKQIMTSALATAKYIHRQHTSPNVYVIGENGLNDALKDYGCTNTNVNVDYVVVGIDREINYEQIARASLLIQKGATFISTNKDPAIPKEVGLLPGNGAITAAVSVASGHEPIFIGKPNKYIMQEAIKEIGFKSEELLMVGDNYLTDITAGINAKVDTLMLLTGYSQKEDIDPSIGRPTYIATDLYEWMKKQAVD